MGQDFTHNCFAESEIPNLVGTGAVKSEGTQLNKGDATGTWSHYREGANTLTAELIVTKQQGRVLYATITSKNAAENAVAVIGWDNKNVYFADQDGFTDATLVSNNKMTYIYRHVGENDSVVAVGIMARKK